MLPHGAQVPPGPPELLPPRTNEPPLEAINQWFNETRVRGAERSGAEEGRDLRELVEDVAVARELLGDGGGVGAGGGAAAHGVVDVLQLA